MKIFRSIAIGIAHVTFVISIPVLTVARGLLAGLVVAWSSFDE